MAKAASHLAMSQSAVSEAIAHLEDAVRVRLLDRTPQGIKPTIYAEVLLKREHAVFDELKQGIKDIEFLVDPTSGEVRIACPEFLTAGLVTTAIERLMRRSPKIAVRITQLNTASLEFRELRERTVDLVLARPPATFADEDISTEILFDDPLFIVAGTQSPWAHKRAIKLADLVKEAWILPPSPVIDDDFKQAFESRGLKCPSAAVSAHSIQLRNQLLATGCFLSVLGMSLLQANAERWSLKALPVDATLKAPPVAIMTLKNRTHSPVVERFIEELRAVVKIISS
jgi:DNA-binding transcriptional LysR family regulator